MKLKNMILLIAVGFCTGVVAISSLNKLTTRTVAVGGEIFFVPMIILLVWFGWMLRDEFKKIVKVRKYKNGITRRK